LTYRESRPKTIDSIVEPELTTGARITQHSRRRLLEETSKLAVFLLTPNSGFKPAIGSFQSRNPGIGKWSRDWKT